MNLGRLPPGSSVRLGYRGYVIFSFFSCYSGLSYADVQKLKTSDVGIGVDGERWIFTYRKKNDTRAAISLLPIAAAMLAQYSDHPYCVNLF